MNLKQEHINTYCWIKKEFDKDKNIAKDIEFQRKFKVFYIRVDLINSVENFRFASHGFTYSDYDPASKKQ